MGAQVGNRWVEELRHGTGQPPMKICKRISPAKRLLNNVKKTLFPLDAEDVQCPKQICIRELRRQQEAQRQKWNFDFASGKPMDGLFQWEQVNVTRARTAPVQPARRDNTNSEDSRVWETIMDEKAEVQTYPILRSSSKKTPGTTSLPKPSASSTGPKLKQKKITDVFKERKRRLSSTVPAENISAKKVRMMVASSSTSPDNALQQQPPPQQQEASASSAN